MKAGGVLAIAAMGLLGVVSAGEPEAASGHQAVALDSSTCLPLVPIQVSDRKLLWGLMIGAARTVVDTRLLGLLQDKPAELPGDVRGRSSAALTPIPLLRMGADILCKVHARTTDFRAISCVNGQFFPGALGADAFAGKSLQVDFDNQRVLLLDSDRMDVTTLGTPYDLGVDKDGDLVLRATVDGLDGEIEFGLNMIGDMSGLRTQTFNEYAARHSAPIVLANSISIGGTTDERLIKVRRLQFGVETVEGMVFSDGGRYSMLSLDFLRRYLVTVDYRYCKLYLKKRAAQTEANEMMSGLMTGRVDKRTFALAVRKDGPAWNAGIRPDDTILKIDGREAGGITMGEILRILNSGEGKGVEIETSTKDGQAFKRTVVLKKLL